jgi:WD40 repeat protein
MATLTPPWRRVLLVTAIMALFCNPSFFIARSPVHASSRIHENSDSLAGNTLETDRSSVTERLSSKQRVDAGASSEWARVDSPDGQYQLVARRGYQCELLDMSTDQARPLPEITCAVFSSDGAQLITGDRRGKVCAWNVATGMELEELAWVHVPIHSIDLSPDSRRIAAADETGTVHVFDLADPLADVELSFERSVRCVRFSPNGERMAVALDTWRANTGCRVLIYDMASQQTVQQWDCDSAVGAIEYLSEESIVVADWFGRVERRRLPGGKVEYEARIAKSLVSAESFSVNSRAIESAIERMESFERWRERWNENFRGEFQ